MANDSWVALRRRGDVFRAGINHLDGTPRLMRQQSRMRRDNGRILVFAAETAAGGRLNHNRLLIAQIEKLLDRFVDVVWALHRPHHRQRILPWNGDHSLRFDVKLLLMRHAILAGDYVIGLPEAFVDVAARDQKTFEDIVGAVNDL